MAHCITQKNHFSLVLNHQDHVHLCSSTGTSTQQIFFPTTLHRRVIWSFSSTLCSGRLIHHLHLCLMTMHLALWDFTRSPCAQPQARPTLQISFLTVLHRRIIWSSSQLFVRRRPSLCSSSVSGRNHTPLSRAFSQVCVLDNVSRSCNHQHFHGLISVYDFLHALMLLG
jgi:hypothetical protein